MYLSVFGPDLCLNLVCLVRMIFNTLFLDLFPLPNYIRLLLELVLLSGSFHLCVWVHLIYDATYHTRTESLQKSKHANGLNDDMCKVADANSLCKLRMGRRQVEMGGG